MNLGYFNYPLPVNEPVLNYAPGSAEKKRLKEVLAELKSTEIDVPMYIGSKEVRTNKKHAMHPPHEHKHVLGYFHTVMKNMYSRQLTQHWLPKKPGLL
jgi:1-pyrroline-5-carboxylate dehydrogenase